VSRIVEPSIPGSQQQQAPAPARSRLVQRLLDASASLPAFLNDLLTTQAVLVAGTEAAAFLVERQGEELALRVVAHIRPDDSDAETRAQAVRAFQNIIQPCVVQSKDGAIEVGSPDGGDAQYCLVTVLRNEGVVVAVSAVVTRCRDMERAKQRLTSMQLVAGYFELFSLRRYTDQARALADRHQNVLQCVGALANAEGFKSGAMALCNELATRTGAVRVSLGWLKGVNVKVMALSHTEKFDKKQELVVQIQRVMEECLDQEEPVRFDPGGNCSPNVTRAARELSEKHGGNLVLSLPLRRRDDIVGVLTLEFPASQPFTAEQEAAAGVAAEVLAPQLYDRYENDRLLITKIAKSFKDLGKHARSPRYMGIKLLILTLIASVLFISFFKINYTVRAPFQFVAMERRTLCAPFEGRLDEVYLRPGLPVREGQVLARMNTDQIRLELARAESDAAKLRLQADRARQENRINEVEAALAEAEARMAEAAIFRLHLERAEIRAPISGVLQEGDLRDRIGMPVRQGDPLFVIALADVNQPGHIAVEVEARVSERDIEEVRAAFSRGRPIDGELATTAFPRDKLGFKITRIVPLGEPDSGENRFRVYGTIPEPDYNLIRPGLAGEARVNIDKRTILWVYGHRVWDWLKLKAWGYGWY